MLTDREKEMIRMDITNKLYILMLEKIDKLYNNVIKTMEENNFKEIPDCKFFEDSVKMIVTPMTDVEDSFKIIEGIYNFCKHKNIKEIAQKERDIIKKENIFIDMDTLVDMKDHGVKGSAVVLDSNGIPDKVIIKNEDF